jgi:hypothetical protein
MVIARSSRLARIKRVATSVIRPSIVDLFTLFVISPAGRSAPPIRTRWLPWSPAACRRGRALHAAAAVCFKRGDEDGYLLRDMAQRLIGMAFDRLALSAPPTPEWIVRH